MPLFDLEQFARDGMLREESVRAAFADWDWEQYRGKTVHIRGCGATPIPTWVYLMCAARLGRTARRITFGEEKSPMMIMDGTE